MDNFSIPKTVLARVEAERPDGTRRTYNAEVMRKVIDDARHDGVSKSAKRHKIPYTTVKTWYDNWVSSKVYPMPGVQTMEGYEFSRSNIRGRFCGIQDTLQGVRQQID